MTAHRYSIESGWVIIHVDPEGGDTRQCPLASVLPWQMQIHNKYTRPSEGDYGNERKYSEFAELQGYVYLGSGGKSRHVNRLCVMACPFCVIDIFSRYLDNSSHFLVYLIY